ncbi:MAG: ABC transporter permease [Eubacteriales bacterium]|nr:ABC transporter permease [Eubacteriales bacterium]
MKNKMYGWQKVYGFSMKQRLKGKSFRVAVMVLFAVAFLSLPVISMFTNNMDGRKEAKKSRITDIYMNDHGADISEAVALVLKDSDIYANVRVNAVNEDSKLKYLEDNMADYIYVDAFVNMGVQYQGYYGESENISKDDAEDLVNYVSDNSRQILMYSKGLNKAEVDALSMDYSSEVNFVKAGNNGMEIVEDTEGLGFDEYGFSYGLLMISMMLIMIGSSSVAEAVVTEKSTRVIEYLLINVKPMAIVLGKILAAVTAILLELAAVAVGFAGSVIVNGLMFPAEDGSFVLPQMVESLLSGHMFAKTSALGIIISLLIFLLGVVFYGFVAGIAGASVSRIEDTQEGMKLFTMVSIIGAYLSLFLLISENTSGSNFGALTYVVYLLPLSAPFIMPEYLILGKVSLLIGALSLVIMVVAIICMLILVSNIYGALIYHRGAPLKVKDIIGISKAERRQK